MQHHRHAPASVRHPRLTCGPGRCRACHRRDQNLWPCETCGQAVCPRCTRSGVGGGDGDFCVLCLRDGHDRQDASGGTVLSPTRSRAILPATGNRNESRPASRYEVLGNVESQYVDAPQTVLVNRLGITKLRTLQQREEKGLATAYERLLAEVRMDTPMTCELLRHIHGRIFGDLYDWAGRWRTVRISKPGVTWPPPDYLAGAMDGFERAVLARYPAATLTDDAAFCQAVGHIQGEMLAIHPFREGNARAVKLLTDLLAVQSGRPLLRYDQSRRGRAAYIAAARSAILQDFEPMAAIIARALAAATRAA